MHPPQMNSEKQTERSGGLHGAACYAVLSCRWGWINNGFDVLRVTTDLAEAIAVAEAYAEHRGGKYGVGVFDASGKQIYHAASIYAEKELHNNYRIDTFERVGGLVSCAFECGEEPNMELAKRRWEEGVRIEDMNARHNVLAHPHGQEDSENQTECFAASDAASCCAS
jgi:hypothetical protein